MGIEEEDVVLLKRLYLDKGMIKNSVDIYRGHLVRLSVVDATTLKLLYAIYSEISLKIENKIGLSKLSSFKEKLELEEIELEKEDKLVKYTNGRIKEDDVKRFLKPNWIDNLVKIDTELDYYFEYELLDIYIKGNVMKELIETYITLKDEYWCPSTLKVVKNIALLGHSIEERKERIWQPKS